MTPGVGRMEGEDGVMEYWNNGVVECSAFAKAMADRGRGEDHRSKIIHLIFLIYYSKSLPLLPVSNLLEKVFAERFSDGDFPFANNCMYMIEGIELPQIDNV